MDVCPGGRSLTLIYFSASLFVSAFLLFMVQPMIGKMILPRLGGTPQVWNTCMMFFQTALLVGYAYSHRITSKLPVKKQLAFHCLALLLPIVVLLMFGRPFSVTGFGAEGGGTPVWNTLGLLSLIVGIPFIIVSTNAPLLQRWFHHTGDPAAKDPYFLYGASNAGSILGLLLYPAVVERYLGLDAQAWAWLIGYLVLAVMVAGCAFFVLKAPPSAQIPFTPADDEEAHAEAKSEAPKPETAPAQTTAVTATPPAPAVQRATGIRRGGKQRGGRGHPPAAPTIKAGNIDLRRPVAHAPAEPEKPFVMTGMRRLRWIGLAAVPTSLMLGTTTWISTDISPIPLLWIIPLTLYLLSFVLVFSRWPVPWVGIGRNPPYLTPHKCCIVLQLLVVPLLMLTIMTNAYSPPERAMLICWGAFFITALVCHGELARDRPPARYLTEFYLWMSVGGMIGGTFNGLIAPLVPWFGLFEFPLAIVFAALVRPDGKGSNWTDFLFEQMPAEQVKPLQFILDIGLGLLLLFFSWFLITKGSDSSQWNWRNVRDPSVPTSQGMQVNARYVEANDKFNPLYRFSHKTMGFGPVAAYRVTMVLGSLLIFGIPIGLALLTWKRPLRLACCFGAVLLGSSLYDVGAEDREDSRHRTVFRDRSYFGLLRVIEDGTSDISPLGLLNKEGKLITDGWARTLMHGSTHHGLNYFDPPQLARLATTYYHRDGPVGATMEKLNWFPGLIYRDEKTGKDKLENTVTYWADARLPASLIGNGVPGLGMNMPLPQLVAAWSEPPYATIGLGTGTMASYGRPFQHVVFYEIDEHIRDFSLPPPGRSTFFSYVQGAIKRGSKVEIIMGDARLTMSKDEHQANPNATYLAPSFPVEADATYSPITTFSQRQNYYRVLVVDAFSSDAIPVHLITKEAIELYMSKLVQGREIEEPDPTDSSKTVKRWMSGGVLCVHTSNRHVNLVKPVINICSVAEWDDWYDRDESGKPKKKSKLKFAVGKDEGEREVGHFGQEYVLVARDQRDLPPYDYSPRQIEQFRKDGIRPVAMNEKQFKELEEALREPGKDSGIKPLRSTIHWTTPDMTTELQRYDYAPSPGMRVWTDDYSNVLSVFRFHFSLWPF
jgi:hypothetical protein